MERHERMCGVRGLEWGASRSHSSSTGMVHRLAQAQFKASQGDEPNQTSLSQKKHRNTCQNPLQSELFVSGVRVVRGGGGGGASGVSVLCPR